MLCLLDFHPGDFGATTGTNKSGMNLVILSIKTSNPPQLPVVPARGGAEVALKIYMRPFSSIELAGAVRQPSPCVHAFFESGVLFHMSHLKLHFALHASHSTLHTARFTLHTPHCTLPNPHFTLHSPHFSLLIAFFTLHTSHCTLHAPHFTLHSSGQFMLKILFTTS